MQIEQSLIAYLSNRLDVSVSVSVPKNHSDSFVTLERVGGGSDGICIDRPSVAIQCWGKSRSDAHSLAHKVDTIMRDFENESGVLKVERNSLVNFPSPTEEPRYQLVFNLVVQL